jgi:ribosome-interacting GTPase 1
MPFEDIQVQLVDLPAVAPGATPAWLRGIVPQADVVLLVIDLDTDPAGELKSLEAELEGLHAQEVPALVVGTKLDLPAAADGAELLKLELDDGRPLVLTSCVSGDGLDELRMSVVQALDVVRVYAKPPGRPPDLSRPFVLRQGATVEDLADVVHHEVRQALRYAVRWTPGAAPLRVGHQYRLADRDVIELHAG